MKLFRVTTIPMSLEKLIPGQMRFMSEKNFEVVMISSDFSRKKELERDENGRFIPINMTRKISPFEDLKALFKLIKILRFEKPHIIHSHTPKAGMLSMIAGKLAGVPIRLHTVAGLPLMETTGFKRLILELVEKLTYACATKVYPNSNNLKEFIIKSNFCSPSKLTVIGNGSSNGINTDEFKLTPDVHNKAIKISENLGISDQDFVYIFIGRLVKDKGIEELVTAFSNLASNHPNLKLLLVGPEEPELDPLSETTKHLIASNANILTVGYQDDVKPYLAISNVLVFPSYREGFPNVPMQAGAMGLPSIVSNINGCNEIIVEGENGYIIPVKNASVLQAKMAQIVEDKQSYDYMAANARQMIESRYSQQHVWQLILQEYKMHLSEKNYI